MKKVFKINAALCDARKVQEETLAAYDEIRINSSIVLVSPTAQALLNKYPVSMNTSTVLETEEEVTLSSVNGQQTLAPGGVLPQGKCYLMVNGMLEAIPGCEELLKSYVGITVNGMVICPKSLAGYFASAQINGRLETYPDDCIRLKSTAVLDKTFHLRAREGANYYAAGRVVALDSAADLEALARKRVTFTTKKLLVAESLCEKALPLFNEEAEIVVLPDGCVYVNDDAVLDEDLLRRHGDKLYINGDLTVNKKSGGVLDAFNFLKVNGDLRVTKSASDLAAKVKAEYNELKIVADKVIAERDSLTVDRALLESVDSLSIAECERVEFADDVSPELIREKLVKLVECELVVCTKEQRAPIELAAVEVERICEPGQEPKKEAGENEEVRMINASTYVL